MITKEQIKVAILELVDFDELYEKLSEMDMIGMMSTLEVSPLLLEWMLEHFEEKEEYEKCAKIKLFLDLVV